MTYDRFRQKAVLFGGSNTNETWEWDGTSWNLRNPSVRPTPRTGALLSYFDALRISILYGGNNSNETWAWDGTNWQQLQPTGVPPPRTYAGIAHDAFRRQTVLNGGISLSGAGSMSDTWVLTAQLPPPTVPLTCTSLTQTGLPALSHHAVAPTQGGGLLTFGGDDGALGQPFTYTLAGGTWSQQYSLQNPMARRDHTLLLDPVRGNNLLFGGKNTAGAALGDTWTWSSGQWSYQPMSAGPAPRSGHRMVFDRAQGLSLLFGGIGANNTLFGDFWSWNGVAWNAITGSAMPQARHGHGLAYDQRRDRTVLFGGATASGNLSDLWEWDHTTWNLIQLAAPVGNRSYMGTAYDPRAERTVLFGDADTTALADSWAWDGELWTRLVPSGSAPQARSGSVLLHDPTSNQLLLHAGGNGTTLYNDLWQFDVPVFWRGNTSGSGCQGSNGRTMALSIATGSTGVIGQTMQMQLTNVPFAFFLPYGLLGLSNSSFNGLPLPLDLTVIGLPGCTAYTSGDTSLPMSLPTAAGTSTWNLPIPSGSYLLGIEIYLQGLSFEPPGFSRWASVSNLLTVRLGNQ